jgi:hypothetical protein
MNKNIEGIVKISLNKDTGNEKIVATIYVNDIMDSEVVVDTEIHEEGSIKDGINTYISRLNKLCDDTRR